MKLSIAIIILCAALAVNAKAQTAAPQTIRANVPFTFTVGDKTLPAGVYTVRILNPASDRKALQIRSEDGHFSAIIQTVAVKGSLADNAKLVFRRYGERHFFAKVQLAGDSTSFATTKNHTERATERALKHPASNTEIAAL